MTDHEKTTMEKCVSNLYSIDQMMEEWEPQLRQSSAVCVRTNLLIRYMLTTQIAAIEDLVRE